MSLAKHVLADVDAVAHKVAEELATLCPAGSKKPFYLAVSGGSTPKKLFALLAGEFAKRIAWPCLHVFWVDERCVPVDSKDSNYGVAKALWLDKVAIPAAQIHPMPAQGDPAEGARAYAATLQRCFACDTDDVPSFHLILLGMGADGHTASLFPGHAALQEHEELVVAVLEAKMAPPQRLSVTMPVLINARQIWFLVTGADKQARLQTVLSQTRGAQDRYPAARVQAGARKATWFLDQAAVTQPEVETAGPPAA